MALADAYAACQRLAASHYENFPVASRLLPRRMRPHVAAVYTFARVADDFADEDGLSTSERYARLDDWLARLRAAADAGPAVAAHPPVIQQIHAADVFEALGHTMRTCDLPLSSLEDLLSAFRQDVSVRRYATWEDVLDYCRRSANPVGRLVLRIAGYRDATLEHASDALCTALQLTNFWQDLAIDWRRGRLYLPEAEREAAGAREEDLDAGRITEEWRVALRHAADRTRELFRQGRPVCDGVSGRLRYELRATWLGASRVLERLEGRGFDVFAARPTLGAADAAAVALGLVRWKSSRGSSGAAATCSI